MDTDPHELVAHSVWGLSLSYDPATLDVWLFGGYYAFGDPPVGFYLNSTWRFTPLGVYPLTFTEVGLPSGTPWNVTVGDSSVNSTATNITFQVLNGSHPYSIKRVPGYAVVPASGTQLVSGEGATTTVVFTPDIYTVTFSETGLPSGTSWNVTFAGSKEASTNATITFRAANGAYPYRIANVSGYSVIPGSGTQVISGGGATITVLFTPNASSSSSSDTFWEGAIVGGAVVGAVVAAVFLLRSKRPPVPAQ